MIIPAACLAADTEQEIHHLLRFVENSHCVFVRNDKEYGSFAAREHLQKKYDYIKSRVKTAEDFINHVATKSSISGKPYMILCNGHEMTSAAWLQAELDAFRKKRLGALN